MTALTQIMFVNKKTGAVYSSWKPEADTNDLFSLFLTVFRYPAQSLYHSIFCPGKFNTTCLEKVIK